MRWDTIMCEVFWSHDKVDTLRVSFWFWFDYLFFEGRSSTLNNIDHRIIMILLPLPPEKLRGSSLSLHLHVVFMFLAFDYIKEVQYEAEKKLSANNLETSYIIKEFFSMFILATKKVTNILWVFSRRIGAFICPLVGGQVREKWKVFLVCHWFVCFALSKNIAE